jgi:hypothetical protein
MLVAPNRLDTPYLVVERIMSPSGTFEREGKARAAHAHGADRAPRVVACRRLSWTAAARVATVLNAACARGV